MSDEDLQNDPVIDQLEAEPIEAPNPIADFLKSVEDQDFVEAEKQFNDMVGDRLQDTLDQARRGSDGDAGHRGEDGVAGV